MKKRVLKLYPADNEMMTMFSNLQLGKQIIDEPTLVPDLPIVENSLKLKDYETNGYPIPLTWV